jgi:hypothetical protein
MADAAFVLSWEQRDDIMKALGAIERQLKAVATHDWQSLWVICNSLAAIHVNLTNLPHASSD